MQHCLLGLYRALYSGIVYVHTLRYAVRMPQVLRLDMGTEQKNHRRRCVALTTDLVAASTRGGL